jgi:hypothetical protein
MPRPVASTPRRRNAARTARPERQPFVSLLPWLARRHDFVTGAFRGDDVERGVSPELLTSMGREILESLDLLNALPYVSRHKLLSWPPVAKGTLPSGRNTPLHRAALGSMEGTSDELEQAVREFLAADGGYSLTARGSRQGSLAAAHLLLTEIRPAWLGRFKKAPPPLPRAEVAEFLERILPAESI